MFWIEWGNIPRRELGPARGPIPSGLMPRIRGGVLPWQRETSRERTVAPARSGGGTPAFGGIRIDLLGVVRAILGGIPIVGQMVAQRLPPLVQFLPADTRQSISQEARERKEAADIIERNLDDLSRGYQADIDAMTAGRDQSTDVTEWGGSPVD